MNNNESIHGSLKNELEEIRSNVLFSPAYRKKKLLFWMIRTTITVVLYIIFWKYSWVRWTLVVAIPLSVLNLALIIAYPYIFKRKFERTKEQIEKMEKHMPGKE